MILSKNITFRTSWSKADGSVERRRLIWLSGAMEKDAAFCQDQINLNVVSDESGGAGKLL
jgi:hypothetical protein